METFNDIPINREEISQCDLNISNKVRSNIFTWNGQFSPQFIEQLLNKYAKSDDVVIDPFLGSGTVLYECARKNISAYGIELNASAYFMAKTYELVNSPFEERKECLYHIEIFINSILKNEEIISKLLEFKESQEAPISNIISLLVIIMDIHNNEITLDLLQRKWNDIKQIINNLPYTTKKISALMGDSRNIGLPNNLADLLITSPPYINVFN